MIITFNEMPEEPPLHGLSELSDILNSCIAVLKEIIEDVDDELDEVCGRAFDDNAED